MVSNADHQGFTVFLKIVVYHIITHKAHGRHVPITFAGKVSWRVEKRRCSVASRSSSLWLENRRLRRPCRRLITVSHQWYVLDSVRVWYHYRPSISISSSVPLPPSLPLPISPQGWINIPICQKSKLLLSNRTEPQWLAIICTRRRNPIIIWNTVWWYDTTYRITFTLVMCIGVPNSSKPAEIRFEIESQASQQASKHRLMTSSDQRPRDIILKAEQAVKMMEEGYVMVKKESRTWMWMWKVGWRLGWLTLIPRPASFPASVDQMKGQNWKLEIEKNERSVLELR